jgi:hypothetical protein
MPSILDIVVDLCSKCKQPAKNYCFVCESFYCDECIKNDTCEYSQDKKEDVELDENDNSLPVQKV